MNGQDYPHGWDEARVKDVLAHYEAQTEDEEFAEIEAALGNSQVRESPFMPLTLEQFGIDRLTPQQRCDLIDLLRDSLPDDMPYVPPAWHLRELVRRIAAADADPGGVEPWEEVLARLSRKPRSP